MIPSELPPIHASDPTGYALAVPRVPLEAPKRHFAAYAAPKASVPLSLSQEQVKRLVEDEFGKGHVMVRIAEAESSFSEKARNPRSTAKGVFQILDGTWMNYGCTGNVLNAKDNIECARKIYEKSGTTPWLDSSDKW